MMREESFLEKIVKKLSNYKNAILFTAGIGLSGLFYYVNHNYLDPIFLKQKSSPVVEKNYEISEVFIGEEERELAKQRYNELKGIGYNPWLQEIDSGLIKIYNVGIDYQGNLDEAYNKKNKIEKRTFGIFFVSEKKGKKKVPTESIKKEDAVVPKNIEKKIENKSQENIHKGEEDKKKFSDNHKLDIDEIRHRYIAAQAEFMMSLNPNYSKEKAEMYAKLIFENAIKNKIRPDYFGAIPAHETGYKNVSGDRGKSFSMWQLYTPTIQKWSPRVKKEFGIDLEKIGYEKLNIMPIVSASIASWEAKDCMEKAISRYDDEKKQIEWFWNCYNNGPNATYLDEKYVKSVEFWHNKFKFFLEKRGLSEKLLTKLFGYSS